MRYAVFGTEKRGTTLSSARSYRWGGGGVQGEIEEDEAENTLMNAPCQNNAIRSWSFTSFLLDDFKIPCHGIPL